MVTWISLPRPVVSRSISAESTPSVMHIAVVQSKWPYQRQLCILPPASPLTEQEPVNGCRCGSVAPIFTIGPFGPKPEADA